MYVILMLKCVDPSFLSRTPKLCKLKIRDSQDIGVHIIKWRALFYLSNYEADFYIIYSFAVLLKETYIIGSEFV